MDLKGSRKDKSNWVLKYFFGLSNAGQPSFVQSEISLAELYVTIPLVKGLCTMRSNGLRLSCIVTGCPVNIREILDERAETKRRKDSGWSKKHVETSLCKGYFLPMIKTKQQAYFSVKTKQEPRGACCNLACADVEPCFGAENRDRTISSV